MLPLQLLKHRLVLQHVNTNIMTRKSFRPSIVCSESAMGREPLWHHNVHHRTLYVQQVRLRHCSRDLHHRSHRGRDRLGVLVSTGCTISLSSTLKVRSIMVTTYNPRHLWCVNFRSFPPVPSCMRDGGKISLLPSCLTYPAPLCLSTNASLQIPPGSHGVISLIKTPTGTTKRWLTLQFRLPSAPLPSSLELRSRSRPCVHGIRVMPWSLVVFLCRNEKREHVSSKANGYVTDWGLFVMTTAQEGDGLGF